MATDLRIKEQLPELTRRIVETYQDVPTIHYLGHCPLPNYEAIISVCEDLKEILYPGYRRRENLHLGNVTYHVGDLVDGLHDKLTTQISRALRHSLSAQRAATGEAFFLFSGRLPQPGRGTEILTDAYAFDPRARTWRTLSKINSGAGLSVMAGTAVPVGDDEILLFGGDRGELFLELEAHDLAVESLRRRLTEAPANDRAPLEREIAGQLTAKKTIYETHPGFAREVLAYDTRRDAWRVVTRSPLAPQVTTFAGKWGDAVVIPSGEIRPGVRTPAVVRVKPVTQ